MLNLQIIWVNKIRKKKAKFHFLILYLFIYLNKIVERNASNMYFFFRWILISFKREFSFDDVMHLWEVKTKNLI
jgi:hypothetical protein